MTGWGDVDIIANVYQAIVAYLKQYGFRIVVNRFWLADTGNTDNLKQHCSVLAPRFPDPQTSAESSFSLLTHRCFERPPERTDDDASFV